MDIPAVQFLTAGTASALSLMLLVWIVSLLLRNAGIVDVAWAFGFILVTSVYSVMAHASSPRHLVLVAMVAIWSIRLGYHLGARFVRWYPNEDPRYAEFRKKSGDKRGEKILLVYMWQGLMLALLSAPMAVALADSSRPDLGWLQLAGLAIWLVSLIGETVADSQLAQFSSKESNRAKTCQVGLWRYSRHPNYFFEWLGSVSFFIYALDSRYGAITVLSPLLLLHLLINVTGVKPSEKHSMATRSDYADYVRRTSPFIPWVKKND
jgi:steroid 5-alpha reductase family enzyme